MTNPTPAGPGSPAGAVVDTEVGRVLAERYRLIARIGTGTSAAVYLADDVTLRRRVAVKLLHPGLEGDERFARRFRAEAQAAAALSHPNILVVHDWGVADGRPFLVTEHLAGGSLQRILDAGHRLTVSQVVALGIQAARGLDHAHRRGIVHRDIKPANLLFDSEGRLRIADFGLAHALAEAAWTEPEGTVVGTARYAAPEQLTGGSVDGRADVYALAVVLVEAHTGRPAFAAADLAGVLARVDQPLEVPGELGPVADILRRAGSPLPADRPWAANLEVALMAAATRLPAPEPLPVGEPPDPAPSGPPTVAAPVAVIRADRVEVGDLPPPTPPAPGGEVDRPGEPGVVPAPARRRRWLTVLLSALVVGASLGVAAWWLTRPAVHEIPALAGSDAASARERLVELGFEVTERRERRDGTVRDEVLGTEPPAGERLAEGSGVVLVISDGPTLREVPDVLGADAAEAAERLTEAGFTPVEGPTEHHEEIPAGAVIATDPAPGDQLPTGGTVTLTISEGPAPRTVPDLAGSDPDEAADRLAGLGLRARITEAFDDDVPAGVVIGTDPPAGTEVPRDTEVTVVVSKGPDLVRVPETAGMRVAEAIEVLERAGFVVEEVDGRASARVLDTDPPGGTMARRGSSVIIVTRRR